MTVFATLGPAGTNHELVTQRYIEFHDLQGARIQLYDGFDAAIEALTERRADFVVQCAVHPDTPRILGGNFRRVFACDTFISPSKDLAVLTRENVEVPQSLALLYPATASYVDTDRWKTLIPVTSIPYALEGLLDGRYDSGLVYLEYAARYPGRFRIEEVIGSPDDAWIVYGRERTYRGGVQACRTSPAIELIKRASA